MVVAFYSTNSKIKEGTLVTWKQELLDNKKTKQKFESKTPHVTPPTPVGPSTPPAAPKQVSHRRFCLWSAPNPASAPRCSPLFVASPQYTLNPRSAAGRDPRRPPMPEFPAVSFSEPCAFGLPFSAFPRLGKLDFPLMYRRFPQPACIA
ncbi:hypothetical protein PGT21_027081, partial [Puccinia graminis f. sp. tritici]